MQSQSLVDATIYELRIISLLVIESTILTQKRTKLLAGLLNQRWVPGKVVEHVYKRRRSRITSGHNYKAGISTQIRELEICRLALAIHVRLDDGSHQIDVLGLLLEALLQLLIAILDEVVVPSCHTWDGGKDAEEPDRG